MRKFIVITGTRAEYGIFKPVLKAINERIDVELSLIAIGMHLLKDFGYTINEIEKDGFKISAKIEGLYSKDSGADMAKSIGKGIVKLTEVLDKAKPDILLLLGDRGEMLAGAIAATYMSIPIAHIHGGEVSGNVDGVVRHAITKLAHIHFPATEESANRIIKMGEAPSRVYVVGAPSLDSILKEDIIEPTELSKKYDLDLSKPILLVIHHPVILEFDNAPSQIRETLEAISELKYQTILVYPNADAGGRRMIEVIKEYEKSPFIKTIESIPYREFLSLMNIANAMVGNSSSGIIEAPSFGLPVVNIGSRQDGRQRSTNVIDVGYNRKGIKAAIKKALYDEDFKRKAKECKNPYGNGKASIRIADILSKIKIDKELLQKRFTW
ncbi:MAG: UDP-N-acetylglucosamine 2-epimerase [Candidatus Bathyarchaeota archaeon]|nr:UDP-N-acetylglucosamine 2-epimerase [Candidatus Bathyarchaeota archaeon]MCZ2845474.1 UDP-N-acetylglucosamine 2-epimerase [Candidatus Bathyarchaeota archaeon]